MYKNLMALSVLSLAYYINSAAADSLLTTGANAFSAGTIQFDGAPGWVDKSVNNIDIYYYDQSDCPNVDQIGTTERQSGDFTGFSPFPPQVYNINGTSLYAIASNPTYTSFTSKTPAQVLSFKILYFNSSGGGMSGASGAPSCPCYNVTVNSNAYEGLNTYNSIGFLSSGTCSMA